MSNPPLATLPPARSFSSGSGRQAVAAPALFPALCPIPAGEAMLGGVEEDKFVSAVELPRHHVVFSTPFALGRAPVTRAEWRAIMGGLPPGAVSGLSGSCPVTGVTCADVDMYLAKLSRATGMDFRLPTEAEWEFACRAGGSGVFPGGNTLAPEDANFLYDENGECVGAGMPTPVGCFAPNIYGLVDMLGNVCEWTADIWHPGFDGAPTDGSAWTTGGKSGYRVIRGGAWDHLPRVLRASWRDWAPEQARWDNLGFRIACDL